jgi:hypothetical protein
MTIGLTWRRTARRIKRLKEDVLTISPDYSDRPTPDFLALSFWSRVAPRSRAEVLWTERTNFGEVFSRRSPDPVRDVRRREQQNDVLWARQETSWHL